MGTEPQLHRGDTDPSLLWPEPLAATGEGKLWLCSRIKCFNARREKPWRQLLTGQALKGARVGAFTHANFHVV